MHEGRSDDNEQYSRRVCLRVEGMPLEGRETEEDLASKLVKDFKDIGLDITGDAIERTHRIGPVITDVDDFSEETTRQQVIVKFKSWGYRTKVYRARKKSKSYRYRVDLTRRRLNLLRKAREMAKGITAIEFTFSDVNCRLAFRLNTGDFKFF